MPQLCENKTFSLQTDLGLFCRTGMNQPPTSIQQHTFYYRKLVFNVVKDTLKNAFPETRRIVGKKSWKKAVARFFENHKCQTPQVWKLPQEFVEYYKSNEFVTDKVVPFLNELLEFEWLEIQVFMMEDLSIPVFTPKPQIQDAVYIPNPEIRILPLNYPIHIKNVKKITKKDKGQYFVSIHRDYFTKQVRFNNLSYVYVEMLLEINEREATKSDLVRILMKYESDVNTVMQALDEFENFIFNRNIVLGYKA